MTTKKNDSYEVLIVGAGVIGLACAWRAAQLGMRVCVVDRDEVASGATGVAAGMLAPVSEVSWGEESLLALGLASLGMWDDFSVELEDQSGSPAGYRRCGALHVALDRDEAEVLRRSHELQRRLELDSEWLRPSGCRDLEPGLAPAISGGVHAPYEAAVDPTTLCVALAAAVRDQGGVLELGAEVVGVELRDRDATVRLADDRQLRAEQLVAATGCWSGNAEWLPAEVRPPVRPVKGEILTLRAGDGAAVCERIVAGERVYLVPRDDGRLIVGATVEEKGFDTTVTAGGVHELLREAYRLLPEIAELELVEARAGLRPGTPDNAPVIGREGSTGVILATGHYRNGILLAPATAESVAALLADETPAIDLGPFSPDRFDRGAGDGETERSAHVGSR